MSLKVTRVDTNGVVAFPGSPQVDLDFEPRSIQLLYEGSAGAAWVSTDGSDDEILLSPLMPKVTITQRVKKLWFREKTTGDFVQVIAES